MRLALKYKMEIRWNQLIGVFFLVFGMLWEYFNIPELKLCFIVVAICLFWDLVKEEQIKEKKDDNLE